MVRELGFLTGTFRELGVTHAQSHALIELEREGVLTAGQLASTLNLDKSTLSRMVRALLQQGLVTYGRSAVDRRQRPLRLTAAGRRRLSSVHTFAQRQVDEALRLLRPEERVEALRGIERYAWALARVRSRAELGIRPIRPEDDVQVERIIQRVMPEFGANGPGFAIHDPEVREMSRTYRGRRARYFVLTHGSQVLGGAGYAPLEGGPPDTCELRKMYFLPEARGLGMGRQLLLHVLDAATKAGFRSCYLETLEGMKTARALYESVGFAQLRRPLGATGHFGCDAWYRLKLGRTRPSRKARVASRRSRTRRSGKRRASARTNG